MEAISNKNEKCEEIQQSDAGFTFVDFFPKRIEPTGFLRSTTYENFRAVIDRANEFLRINTKWKILTCETIHFKLSGKKVDPIKVTYKKDKQFFTSYIRGLRLWLTEKENEKEREQKVDYFNLIPQRLERGGIFSSSKFETLNAAIERFNLMLKSNPLPGRIITIESKGMPFTNFDKFDPDLSNWSENGRDIGGLVFVIRIFYEVMDSRSEEIGIKDFIPRQLSEEGFLSLPEYETFSNVMKEASAWLAQQRYFRFCNAQTIEMIRKGNGVDTQIMASTDNYKPDYYVRIFRIAYTKPLANSYSHSEKPSSVVQLSCRDFVPVQLTTGIFSFEYENLTVTKERISAWVKATGARVVSAETTIYRVKSGGEKEQGTDSTFTCDSGSIYSTEESWIFIIRLYLDGMFKEPSPEMLPAVPGIKQSSCCIS